MNYEEKYNAALERARDLMTNQNPPAFDKHLIETVFPELKESEDERIRKALIEIIHDTTGDECEDCYHVSKGSVLAWLEKQGEKKNTRKREIDDAYLQGICDAKHAIEKQGEQKTDPCTDCANDKGCVRTLNADKVIEWLEKHIIEWKGQDFIKTFTPNSPAGKSYIVEQFKQDFEL